MILPFDIAPVQIAFILVEQSEELINYYQEINNFLTRRYRCQLYNKSSRINLNILQADKEGCPFKIILGKEELKKNEITLVRRDNVERKITVGMEINEFEQKLIVVYEKHMEDISKLDGGETKKELAKGKEEPTDRIKKGFKYGKIFQVITRETKEFKKNIYQKSADFRDKHIFSVSDYSELQGKIKNRIKGLFLIHFCNNLECEEKIKEKVPSYSIRCIALEKKIVEPQKCLFCQLAAQNMVYLGRSY